MLSLTRLRVLAAVAEHGSVTGAAEALHYAQPSVSHHLARLEAETGAVLVSRVGRGIRLTEAGTLLAARATEILGRVDAARAELDELTGLRAGRVRLAAFPSALSTLVPAAAARLRIAHPGLTLELTEVEPPEALALLRAGEVDAALVFRHRPDPDDADLRLDPLLAESLLLLGPEPAPGPADEMSGAAADRTAEGTADGTADGTAEGTADGTVTLARYADADWIAGCERCREHLLRLCADAGFAPRIRFTTDDYVAAQALVAAGLGHTVLPELALRAYRRPDLLVRPLPGTGRHVLLARYGRPPDPPAVLALTAALHATKPQLSTREWQGTL